MYSIYSYMNAYGVKYLQQSKYIQIFSENINVMHNNRKITGGHRLTRWCIFRNQYWL